MNAIHSSSGRLLPVIAALAILLSFAVLLSFSGPADAARHKTQKSADDNAKSATSGIQLLGRSGAWSAYASSDRTGRVCYLAGEPGKTEPISFVRSSPMAIITHRPAENIANVVSFVEGYQLKPGSSVVLDVDGKKYELFTKDDSAWASTSDLDRTIVTAFVKGNTITARGEPPHGHGTVDTYSLDGFSKALALIDKACGVKREDNATAATKPAHPAHRASRHHTHSHHSTRHEAQH